jgi:hypothetical protein
MNARLLTLLVAALTLVACKDDGGGSTPLEPPDFAFIGEPESIEVCNSITLDGSGEGSGGGGGGGGGEGSGEGSGQQEGSGCGETFDAGGIDGGGFFAGGAGLNCGALGAQGIQGGGGGGNGIEFWGGGDSSGGSGTGIEEFPTGGGVDFGGWGDAGLPDFDGGIDGGEGDVDEEPCCYLAECPDGTDPECPFICGDGVRTSGFETCDGADCPTSCEQPTAACGPYIARTLVGTPERCSVECAPVPRPCTDGDGCCNFEVACSWLNDTDCPTPTRDVGSACLVDDDCGAAETLLGCLDQENDGFLGGYCTLSTFGVCPDGTHVGQFGGPLAFNCVKDCASDADCRENGYACIDSDFDGLRECAPFAEGDLALGEPCTGYWDCEGGALVDCRPAAFGGPEGDFCTARCNPARQREQGECPDRMLCMGGRCSPSEEICFTGDGLCPTNRYCTVDQDADCIGINAPAGNPCTEDADCGLSVDVACSTEEDGFPDGYCMVQGGLIAECPDGTDLHPDFLNGNPFVSQCWLECTADADCRTPDYACYDLFFRDQPFCAPVGRGTTAFNEPCESTRDCEGGEYALCLSGRCARVCDLSAETPSCPEGAVCSGADFLCRTSCRTDAECADGLVCLASMCMPPRE